MNRRVTVLDENEYNEYNVLLYFVKRLVTSISGLVMINTETGFNNFTHTREIAPKPVAHTHLHTVPTIIVRLTSFSLKEKSQILSYIYQLMI
jgi:hypothetical protein